MRKRRSKTEKWRSSNSTIKSLRKRQTMENAEDREGETLEAREDYSRTKTEDNRWGRCNNKNEKKENGIATPTGINSTAREENG